MPSLDPPRLVISHPGSPPYLRNAVLSLYGSGMLEYFATTYLDHPNYVVSKALRLAAGAVGQTALRQLDRRAFRDIPMSAVRTRATLELFRTLFSAILDWPTMAD